MAPTTQERIERLLDQLEARNLSREEIQRIEQKIELLKKLED